MKKLLVVLLDKFQDIEFTTFVSLIKKADIYDKIEFYNPENKIVTGQFGVVQIETKNHWKSDDFDAIFIPGGVAAQYLRTCEPAIKLINEFFAQNKHVFAICDAPNAIFERNLAPNYQFSSYPDETNSDIPTRKNDLVTVDKNYISARNASSSAEFAFKVIEKLASKEIAEKIRAGFQA
ncbi:DJ-1/PfpI family protein [Mesomycoplasma ovipneumoniae]|uniref:DJ-1/PfpI family protein n=1 Tax=Mesomycoplasma ovipneumoniae TaxID=29562 RepID=UPI00311CC2AE